MRENPHQWISKLLSYVCCIFGFPTRLNQLKTKPNFNGDLKKTTHTHKNIHIKTTEGHFFYSLKYQNFEKIEVQQKSMRLTAPIHCYCYINRIYVDYKSLK